jgi:hypothetical protein
MQLKRAEQLLESGDAPAAHSDNEGLEGPCDRELAGLPARLWIGGNGDCSNRFRDPHVAIGTSAVAVAANAAANLFSHHRLGNVIWRCALVFGASGVAGA